MRLGGPVFGDCSDLDLIKAIDRKQFAVHLDEAGPGQGGLDYQTFLRELARLDRDTPLMIEHLKTEEEYKAAAMHIHTVAEEVGVPIL